MKILQAQVDRAVEEGTAIIERACVGTRWRLVDEPYIEHDGEAAWMQSVTLTIRGMPVFPDGPNVADALAEELEGLAKKLRQDTTPSGPCPKLVFPSTGGA